MAPKATTTPPEDARVFRLLIVENNPAEAELIAERLGSACGNAVDIVHALDMMRASGAAEQGPFDCIVLDLQLPDTSGAEAISAIRARCPAAAILAYSGMDNDASRIAALQAGAECFISRNAGDALLDRCVVQVLVRWRAAKS